MAGQFGGYLNPPVTALIASGQIGPNSVGSGAIQSGQIASGAIVRPLLASGGMVEYVTAGQLLSGITAVALGSGVPAAGGSFLVVPAERQSGLRLPAIGVVPGSVNSGQVGQMVTMGIITSSTSGLIASGFIGNYLYVGSGGNIVNLSGFMLGASSGGGPNPSVATLSGTLVQRVGLAVSGGIYVNPDMNVTSGLLSGLLGVY